ncbi:aminotransferase class IV family protein [Dokdonella sp.]|uniref:aminotransferase class IV family protein n=1 Tax=Dokdonella sp. TaxID=2291710 RepID=UPI001B1AD74E|nr:aminotransferase class IV family protein [Dokdonella sp.]MBO9663985.1 aminotransferase class IV family protein [Dokdonella sp.]
MNRHARTLVELNGQPAGLDDLRLLAVQNYGHFTSMQVRDGGVQGLDRHLDRLQRATQELFAHALDLDATRGWMRQAVAGAGELSLRVNVFSRRFDRERPLTPAAPDVLVTTAPARASASPPLRVGSVHYQREAPHIKHVGTFGLFHQRRLAQSRGYDDALFVASDGAVSEGSIWNVGFFDGQRVIWPDAPMLEGVSMQLLQAGLRESGVDSVVRRVDLAEVANFRAAFFTNSGCAVQPIAAIDEKIFAAAPELVQALDAAARIAPWQAI